MDVMSTSPTELQTEEFLWIIFVNCLFSWGSQGWSLSQLSQGERRVHLHRSQVRKDRNHTLSDTHLYVLGTTWQPSHWTVGEHMNVTERPQLTKTLEPGDFNLGSSAWHHLTAPTSGSNLVFCVLLQGSCRDTVTWRSFSLELLLSDTWI